MEHENKMEIGENEIFIGIKNDALHTHQSSSKTEKSEKGKDDNLSLLTSTSTSSSITPTKNSKVIKTPSPSGTEICPVTEILSVSCSIAKDVSISNSDDFAINTETKIAISDGRTITTENTIVRNASPSSMIIEDVVDPLSNSTFSDSTSTKNPLVAGAPPPETISPINKNNNSKTVSNSTEDNKSNTNIMKNKRKRRRGKPKTNNIKAYKKSNWKFQMPRYRNNDNNKKNSTAGGVGVGGGGHVERIRGKLVRSRSIAPYNTNRFLMEEHMAEVPNALLTPSGRTRDSSFSVDSEDNYFYSLPEDEEEFLTKEFSNVYERARVDRLESMSKQQLIEECLQLEDRYAQMSGIQQQQNTSVEFLNRIRALEERIRELSSENYDLRRKLDQSQGKLPQNVERMCSSSSSEDSESDSSSTSRSSCESSEYSGCSRRSSSMNDQSDLNNSKRDLDENNLLNNGNNYSNGQIYENTNGTNPERDENDGNISTVAISNANSNGTSGILLNGQESSPSKENSPQNVSFG